MFYNKAKSCRRSRRKGMQKDWRYDSIHLNLGTRRKCVVEFTPRPLFFCDCCKISRRYPKTPSEVIKLPLGNFMSPLCTVIKKRTEVDTKKGGNNERVDQHMANCLCFLTTTST